MAERERPTYKQLERENRALKAAERDRTEMYASAPDIEGVGNRHALVVLRDKNAPLLFRLIDSIPYLPYIVKVDGEGVPLHGAEPPGFWGAVQFCQTDLDTHVSTLWFQYLYDPNQVQDYHRVKQMLEEPYVFSLIPPTWEGFRARLALKKAVIQLGYSGAVRHAFDVSQETDVEPIQAQRRGYAD